MAFDVTGLSAYTDEQSRELLTAALLSNKTASFATPMTGVKQASNLHILADTIYFQDGTNCDTTVSGTTTFTDRTMTTYPLAVRMSWCPKDLLPKWTQILLSQGHSWDVDSVISGPIGDHIRGTIKQKLETYDWLGTIAANLYDGVGTIIDAAATYQSATSSTFNASNAITIADNVWATVPAAVKDKSESTGERVRWFLGREDFDVLVTAYKAANLFHFDPTAYLSGEFTAPGTNLLVTVVNGLNTAYNASHKSYAFLPSNMYIGTDGTNEEEVFDLFYSKDDRVVKLFVEFRRGWQVAFPAEVVRYVNS